MQAATCQGGRREGGRGCGGNSYGIGHSVESGGDPYGKNTGRWTLDETTNELYLDSDAGEEDDSHWIVRIEGSTMHWKGTRGDFNTRFSIEHVRAAD